MSAAVWLAPVLAPAAVLAALAFRPVRPVALRLAPWAAAPALAVAILTPDGAAELPWLLLGARVGLHEVGRPLLAVTALVWLAAGLHAAGGQDGSGAPVRFFAFFLAAMSGNLLAILALDGATFQAGYALMGFAAYGLVTHDRMPRSLEAGRLYLALVVLGEVLVFAGAVLLYRTAEGTSFPDLGEAAFAAPAGGAAFLLLLVGFAIKSAVVPLHVWLPPAYAAAPVPGAAVLGGALINAGLLGWLRFLPLGTAAAPLVGPVCIAIGLGSALYGTVVGVCQREAKAALAYSSISQMGAVTTGLGIALMVPAAWPLVLPALLLYGAHHGLCKGALFLGVGAAAGAGGRRRGLAAGALAVPMLALAGAPGSGGAAAKEALKDASHVLPPAWAAAVGGLLPVIAVGTTLVMVRALVLALAPAAPPGGRDLPDRWWPLAALVGLVGSAGWWLPGMAGWSPPAFSWSAAWAALWPVVVGGALAAGGFRARRAGLILRWPSIPPGDIWVPIRRGLAAASVRLARPRRPPPPGS